MIPFVFKALVVATTFLVGVITKEVVVKDQQLMKQLAEKTAQEVIKQK